MKIDYFRYHYDYNVWANQRVWDCVMKLSEEQFTQPNDYSVGSVQGQVLHQMSADIIWLSRLQGDPVNRWLTPEDYPTRDSIRAKWDEVEQSYRQYLAGLDEATLESTISYMSMSTRQERQHIVWVCLLHVINHATDHRAQILAAIHKVGGETIPQDEIYYAKDNPPR